MTRIPVRTSAALLASFLILTGCDAIRGVNRRALVRYVPPSDCVIGSLQSIQGVSSVRYEVRTGGTPLTWTGLKPPEKLHYYFYDLQGLHGNLYFSEDYKGKVEFWQGYIMINRTPRQVEIDTIRPVMRQLERQLETECALPNLSVTIKEWCSGVKCV